MDGMVCVLKMMLLAEAVLMLGLERLSDDEIFLLVLLLLFQFNSNICSNDDDNLYPVSVDGAMSNQSRRKTHLNVREREFFKFEENHELWNIFSSTYSS